MAFQKKIFFVFGLCCFIVSLSSCNVKKESTQPASTQEIIRADLAFSDMCRQLGMKKAFLQYIDDEGTLLRPDRLPIIGAEAINYISVLSDTAYKLSWEPSHAEIAASGELGYTYGIFKLQLPDTVLSGTYVNIWKKEKDGEWKFVLNSDNPGTKQSSLQ
jgi:ketosteroid isomerase-like protein